MIVCHEEDDVGFAPAPHDLRSGQCATDQLPAVHGHPRPIIVLSIHGLAKLLHQGLDNWLLFPHTEHCS